MRGCTFYCDQVRVTYQVKCHHLHERKRTKADQPLRVRCVALRNLVDAMECTPVYTVLDELTEEMAEAVDTMKVKKFQKCEDV